MKTCSRCKIQKSLNEFGTNKLKKDGKKYICKQCESEKYLDSSKAKQSARDRWLKFKYDIDSQQYDLLLKEQNGVCAICHNKEEKCRLPVDHCHTTGKVRGLLCHRCNRSIGLLGEDVGILENAIKYLQKSVASIQHNSD